VVSFSISLIKSKNKTKHLYESYLFFLQEETSGACSYEKDLTVSDLVHSKELKNRKTAHLVQDIFTKKI